MYKTDTKFEVKNLNATTFVIAKLKERLLNGGNREKSNIISHFGEAIIFCFTHIS